MNGYSKGFSLVEIMTVVLAMGILLALAIPNFIKYRNNSLAKSCQVNLRSIRAAVEEARLERAPFVKSAIGDDGEVSIDDLVGGGFLKQALTCPADGSAYTVSFSEGNCTVTCGSGKEGHEISD